MPQPELMAFFRTNTQDLPETAQRWFQLPNKTLEAIAVLNPNELRRRILAGEDIKAILGFTPPRVTPEADRFLDDFVPTMNNLIKKGKGEEAVQHATTSLELAAGQFSDDQLTLVRKKIFEGRASAQGYFLERGELRVLPFGHRLKAYCGLSLAADWMRADLESGQITDRAKTVALGFGYAGMDSLQRKAVERWAGRQIPILEFRGDRGRLVEKFSTPPDPEIRAMQSRILAKLLQGVS